MVPPLKKKLEEFLYEVKIMFINNNYNGSIEFQAMQNFDIQGNDIDARKFPSDTYIDDEDESTEENETV